MYDALYTGQLESHKVAFTLCVSTRMANAAVLAHDCDPVSAHVLGRALTACMLLTPQLAERQDRVNVVWKYPGELRSVVVDAGADGTLRGLVSPRHLAGLGEEVEALYGESGMVKILRTRDGELLTSGMVESRLQNAVSDLEIALCISDQIESGLCVMIGFHADASKPVSLCQGILLQAMPEADPKVFDQFRSRLQSPEVRDLLSREFDPVEQLSELLAAITGEEEPAVQVEACPAPRWRCTCNAGKMEAVLVTLPDADRDDILAKGEVLKVRCEFCNTLYEITPETCRAVWSNR